MEDRDQKKLQKNRVAILNDLEPMDILDYLYQNNIISTDDVERIKVKETRLDRARCLLDNLPSKGPRAFGCFVGALEPNYSWLAKLLRN